MKVKIIQKHKMFGKRYLYEKKKNGLISLLLSMCMFITMAFSSYAGGSQKDEQIQPGWVKVNEYRYENPTTGEYFVIQPNLARAAGVTFSFKIQYSFDCPTKFKASGTSASVKSSAHVEDSAGTWIGGTSYGYAIYVGSKKVSFTTDSSSVTKTVTGLNSGSSYTVSASTLNNMGSYYVVGSATVQ